MFLGKAFCVHGRGSVYPPSEKLICPWPLPPVIPVTQPTREGRTGHVAQAHGLRVRLEGHSIDFFLFLMPLRFLNLIFTVTQKLYR